MAFSLVTVPLTTSPVLMRRIPFGEEVSWHPPARTSRVVKRLAAIAARRLVIRTCSSPASCLRRGRGELGLKLGVRPNGILARRRGRNATDVASREDEIIVIVHQPGKRIPRHPG